MSKIHNILTTGIFLSILLVSDCLSANTPGTNRLFDVNTSLSEQRITYSFELLKKPFFSLRPSDDRCISLSFANTGKPDELKTKIEKTLFLYLSNAGESKNVNFLLSPEKPYGKIECAWINDRSIFIVNIQFNPDDRIKAGKNTSPHSSIKDIRFGFKENGTRMVIGSDKKPRWEIRQSDSDIVSLILDSSSEKVKTKTYYSDKWLRQVKIQGKDKISTELSLDLRSDPNQVGIFWMSCRNRLVLDLFKNPDSQATDLLTGKNAIKNHNNTNKDPLDKKAENNNIVRMKIEKKEAPPASILNTDRKETKTTKIDTEIPTNIKPKFKNVLPDVEDITVDVKNLSPEEAFFFGRIKQAREINDYNMGITLSNQFLNSFKESRLCEEISFWRADFYYDQWERGAKELGGKVIKSYEYAVDRFGHSGNIQISYIKMAKVASEMGDAYTALGYLGNIIIKKDPRYMPLAYLIRGKIFLQINEPEKAIKDFKILLSDYKNSRYGVEANLWLADYYHKIGLYEEAEKRLQEIDKRYPDLYLEYPEFILLNAKNNLYLKKYDEARKYLFKAINIGGQKESTDMLLSRIGDTYHNQDDDKKAEKYYRMVVDYYPDSEGASISKLRLAEYFSDITILDDLSKNKKTNEDIGELAVLEKAYQLYENKQYAEVIKTLKGVANKPVQTETRKEAKRLYIHSIEKEMERLQSKGRFKDLAYLYEDNIISLGNRIKPEALLTVAEVYMKLGRQNEAVSVYSQIKPYDLNQKRRGDYIYGLGEAYRSMGDRKKAISFLEKGKNEKINQEENQKINLLLADLYKLEGRNKDAEKLYSLVIQDIKNLPPKVIAKAYLNLGITFKARKQFREARNAINHTIAIGLKQNIDDSILRSAYIELGNVLYSEGRSKEAVKAFEKGISLGYGSENPEYWDNRFRQAMAYLKTGEDNNAETLFNDISEGDADEILQQRAQLKLGSLALSKQLKILSMGAN